MSGAGDLHNRGEELDEASRAAARSLRRGWGYAMAPVLVFAFLAAVALVLAWALVTERD